MYIFLVLGLCFKENKINFTNFSSHILIINKIN